MIEKDKFNLLADNLFRDPVVSFSSKDNSVMESLFFAPLVAGGIDVIPLIFERWRSKENRWFVVIKYIMMRHTGDENWTVPIPDEHAGRYEECKDAYFRWFQANRFIPSEAEATRC